MKIGIAGLLIGFSFLSAQGQTKMEVEKRVNIGEVPQRAVDLIHGYLSGASKIKWYYEQDGSHQSYECKFKLHRKQYSIEFDQAGYLEDIEISYPRRNLPKSILQTLDRGAKNFNIKKSQIQYKALIHELFHPGVWSSISHEKVNYFFELEVLLDGEFYELLMDSKGNIISKRQIVPPTGLYLEF